MCYIKIGFIEPMKNKQSHEIVSTNNTKEIS